MFLKSLRGKLLFTVSILVIASGFLISFTVTQRFSRALLRGMTTEARNLSHIISLGATDKILINDLVALQKMLDSQKKGNPKVAYIFVRMDGKVLAHTFPSGVPVQLLSANSPTSGSDANIMRIVSTKGRHFLDVARPIFGGKAGVLRLGFSEASYRHEVAWQWTEMSILTLAILLVALSAILVFVKRITNPISDLTRATREIEQGKTGVRAAETGKGELGQLASAFNSMMQRLEGYTRRLEDQALELDRAYHQTRTFCAVVKEIGALRGLVEMGSFLINRVKTMLNTPHMFLLLGGINKDVLFIVSPDDYRVVDNPGVLVTTTILHLARIKTAVNSRKILVKAPITPEVFENGSGQCIIPLRHEDTTIGALITPFIEDMSDRKDEIELAQLTLRQSAGAVKRAVLREERIRSLDSRLNERAKFCGIVGKDPKMQVIYRLIEDISPTDTTVLIQGESGTGKELVANAIHHLSQRKEHPFVVINCSAYPETLLESELFGHEKGAFTGAVHQKSGRFEQADGGTVFLDEIGDISPAAQIRLLRVLQTRKFERLGGTKTLSIDVRILAATNKNLLTEVKEGRFREDLYYRLNVIPLVLPPLRERMNDIPLLARFFLSHFAREQQKVVEDFSPQAMRLLLGHRWPGNVRELENTIEHAVVLARGNIIEAIDFPSSFTGPSSYPDNLPTLEDHEKQLFLNVLNACAWNKKEAAQRLGISRSTLYEKLKKYQITHPVTH